MPAASLPWANWRSYYSQLGYKYGNDGQAFHFVQYTTNGLNFLPGSTVYTKASTNIPVWGDGVPIWWQSSDAEVLAKVPVMTPAI
ncbi:hypothetical protein PtrM4_150720 [Pyrenophora tritici-repentis]|uniref:Uncharacterized protein n=1 Tax=Pyrenophora tritici-repentis TaxID=45151 RepID=A0A834VLY9_9PLEO|nr:hypothetical protein PtrM4_150720 [Pyrenophora tritici-repentis]